MVDKINEMYESRSSDKYQKISWTVGLVLIVLWSLSTVNSLEVSDKGPTIALNIIKGIFSPNTTTLFGLGESGVLHLLLETTAIAFLGTLVGAVFSLPLSFLASSKVVPLPVTLVTRVFVMAVRTIPSFVYGLMFIRVTGPGAFAGVMTLSVTSIGMITKLFSETIDDIDSSILEALDAAGCNTFEKVRCGIIPQLWSSLVSTLIFRFDMNLRDATILGVVGAGGIGAPLNFAINGYKWDEVGAIMIGLIIFILLVEYISTRIRTRLAQG